MNIKPNIGRVVFYLFIRYILFFVLLMIIDGNTKLIQFGSLKTGEDWFFHLWTILFLPILSVILFTAPLYMVFRVKKIIYFFGIVLSFLVIDYFMYVYFTSNKHIDPNGIYNAIVSAILFLLMFLKVIRSKLSKVDYSLKDNN